MLGTASFRLAVLPAACRAGVDAATSLGLRPRDGGSREGTGAIVWVRAVVRHSWMGRTVSEAGPRDGCYRDDLACVRSHLVLNHGVSPCCLPGASVVHGSGMQVH